MPEFSTDPGGRSAREIEREVEAERARVADTIEALEQKISVGSLIDQAVKAFAEHGGTAGRNLGAVVRDNPVPAILTGVGLAWLMMGSGRSYPRDRDRYDEPYGDPYFGRGYDPADDLEDWERQDAALAAGVDEPGGSLYADTEGTTGGDGTSTPGLSERARAGASALGDRAHTGASGLAEAGSAAWSGATGAASSAAERARSMTRGARHGARRRADDMRHRARRAGYSARESFDQMLEDQPLVLGALALALGAAVGGALPRTRTEDAYFGESSDRLKSGVRDIAEQEGQKARATADAVAEETRRLGDEAGAAIAREGSKFVERAEQAADEAADRLGTAASDEAERQGLGKPNV